MLSISGITLTFNRPSEINGMLLAQPTTRFQESTIDLIQQNFGNRVAIRSELEGNASVISTAKAQRVLGFKPRPGWNQT